MDKYMHSINILMSYVCVNHISCVMKCF